MVPLATTVADLALALDVLAGGDAYRAVAPPEQPLRIGVSARPGAVGPRSTGGASRPRRHRRGAGRGGHRVESAGPPWRNGDACPILQRVLRGCAEDTDGLPLGVQLAAAPGGEALVLSLARQLEDLRPWPRHAPLAVAA